MKPVTLSLFSLLLIASGLVYAAQTYSYKCPKCGLIQSYDTQQGWLQCPNDGALMLPCH